jgi:hypothetical protein
MDHQLVKHRGAPRAGRAGTLTLGVLGGREGHHQLVLHHLKLNIGRLQHVVHVGHGIDHVRDGAHAGPVHPDPQLPVLLYLELDGHADPFRRLEACIADLQMAIAFCLGLPEAITCWTQRSMRAVFWGLSPPTSRATL